MKPLELALVGCGAIAQAGYLPALARVQEARCLWLVDLRRPLAEQLARRWRIPHVTTDLGAVLDRVEAVILAVPNHLHAPMALLALERGRAVLCEKPLGRTAAEVRGMVAASRQAAAVLAAGMIFRQYPGLQAVRGARVQDTLGRVREIRACYGIPLDWPLMSPDFFAHEQAGGGVLLDLGVHVLDALLWLLSPQGARVLEYEDDGESQVEAEARARLTLRLGEAPDGVPCLLEVSRVRRLNNRIAVIGENASLLIPLASAGVPSLVRNGSVGSLPVSAPPPGTARNCFAEQIRTFVRTVRGLEATVADGDSQIPVLELIESCYAVRKPLTFPWRHYGAWHPG